MTTDLSCADAIKGRYRRAQTLMQGYWSRNILPNSTVYPIWIEGSDCFWYERDINIQDVTTTIEESLEKWDREYRLVDAKAATNIIAFDHCALATALAEAVEQNIDKNRLPIKAVSMQLDSTARVVAIKFSAFEKSWCYETQTSALNEVTEKSTAKDHLVSPDGRYAIFTRDYNLWLLDISSGKERALTEDGEEQFCYGAVGNGWGMEMGTFSGSSVQGCWSSDSKRVFTLQRDSREVLTMPVVEHVPRDGTIRPKLHTFSMSMQGDEHVPEYRLLSIEINTGRVQPADYRQIPIVRNSWGFFTSHLGWWHEDNRRAYFVDLERDYRTARVVEFDTDTGASRILFEESSDTHLNLMVNGDDFPAIIPLPKTNELVWFSERSGWAHLYLYDLNTGQLKHPITTMQTVDVDDGKWLVREILFVDDARRELVLQTVGRGGIHIDPYYRDLVRVSIDTGKITSLASGDFDYVCIPTLHADQSLRLAKNAGRRDVGNARGISHSGDFAVVTKSRADLPPVNLLLDRDANQVLEIETTDISVIYAMVSESWQWPEPVKLQAADNKTDIYGLVFRPSYFSPNESYPVVSQIYNSPELTWVPKGSFSNDSRVGRNYLQASALAELGFIVVLIDGRGTPMREKVFHDESYGWSNSSSNIDDHVAGIKQLAKRYPYMDLSRVGVHCPVGGAGGVQAVLDYPEFYKVAVISMCFHDSRLFPASMWSDKYEGLAGPDSEYHYPETNANKLQGKLMLVHGMLDVPAPPAITFRLIEAFQKANKDIDLLLLPNEGHSVGSYATRRGWDFLVKNLQGTEPPKEFNLICAWDLS